MQALGFPQPNVDLSELIGWKVPWHVLLDKRHSFFLSIHLSLAPILSAHSSRLSVDPLVRAFFSPTQGNHGRLAEPRCRPQRSRCVGSRRSLSCSLSHSLFSFILLFLRYSLVTGQVLRSNSYTSSMGSICASLPLFIIIIVPTAATTPTA